MEKRQIVYDRLAETACSQKRITYDELANILGLDVQNAEDRKDLVEILQEIAYQENAAGRPLLTAVVVRPEIGYPGKGFFLQARELGFNDFCDERSYYWYELKRVYAFWQNHIPAFESRPYMVAYGYEVIVGPE